MFKFYGRPLQFPRKAANSFDQYTFAAISVLVGFISRIFRRRSKFSALLTELGPELAARYGASSGNHKGQIDKTIQDLKIDQKLTPYAYVLYLRDEDFEKLAAESPEKWARKQSELNDFLEKQPPCLGKSNFYESHKGLL